MESKLSEVTPEEFRADMEDLKESNKQQADYARLTFILTCISTVAVVVAVVFIIVTSLRLMPQINQLLTDTQVSIENVNKITTELSQTDFNALINDVGSLVTTTQDGVASAMEKLESIDFEQLNQAISDLTDVIEPLANFFNSFKF